MGRHKLRTRCFLDVKIGTEKAGRIVIELFNDLCPKASENFKKLCQGACGLGLKTGKPLHYEGSVVHRVIKGFMIQGGDFSNGDGTGGESIYGGTFADECLSTPHDRPFLLSMANRGPNTNGSQFFIITVPSPHLDGKHMVFGHVLSGQDVVNKIESVPISDTKTHRPVKTVAIEACGELVPMKKKKVKTNESEKKKKSKKEKKKKKHVDRHDFADESSDEVVCSVRPEEIPDIPPPKFLYRGNIDTEKSEVRNAEEKNHRNEVAVGRELTQSCEYSDRSGRKLKGRGRLCYRSPDSRGNRQRSVTPPHWRQASINTQRLDRHNWRHWREQRTAMLSTATRAEDKDNHPKGYADHKSPPAAATARNRSPSGSPSDVGTNLNNIRRHSPSPRIEGSSRPPIAVTLYGSCGNREDDNRSSSGSNSSYYHESANKDECTYRMPERQLEELDSSNVRRSAMSPRRKYAVSPLHSSGQNTRMKTSPSRLHCAEPSRSSGTELPPQRVQLSPPLRHTISVSKPSGLLFLITLIRRDRVAVDAADDKHLNVAPSPSRSDAPQSFKCSESSSLLEKGLPDRNATNPSKKRVNTNDSCSVTPSGSTSSCDSASVSRHSSPKCHQLHGHARSPPQHLVQKWRIRRERLIQKCRGVPLNSSTRHTPPISSNDRDRIGLRGSNRRGIRRSGRSRSYSRSPPRRHRHRSSTSHSQSDPQIQKKGRHVVGLDKSCERSDTSDSVIESPVQKESLPLSLVNQSPMHTTQALPLNVPTPEIVSIAPSLELQKDKSLEANNYARSPTHQVTAEQSVNEGQTVADLPLPALTSYTDQPAHVVEVLHGQETQHHSSQSSGATEDKKKKAARRHHGSSSTSTDSSSSSSRSSVHRNRGSRRRSRTPRSRRTRCRDDARGRRGYADRYSPYRRSRHSRSRSRSFSTHRSSFRSAYSNNRGRRRSYSKLRSSDSSRSHSSYRTSRRRNIKRSCRHRRRYASGSSCSHSS